LQSAKAFGTEYEYQAFQNLANMDIDMHKHSMPFCQLLFVETNIKTQTTSEYDFMHIQPLCILIFGLFHITNQYWYQSSLEHVLTQVKNGDQQFWK